MYLILCMCAWFFTTSASLHKLLGVIQKLAFGLKTAEDATDGLVFSV